jgi:preprotein translocase subunit SecA
LAGVAERITGLFWLLGGQSVRRCLNQAEARATAAAAMSDAELVAAIEELVDAPKLGRPDASDGRFLANFLGHELSERDGEAVALAAEAFTRFPPLNVPPGSRLHPGQVLAAVQLLRGAVVQMDTGEGKTFAISTAALALLRLYDRVYVVTANEYLAARDAVKTEPFWTRLGISVASAVDDSARDVHWQARVVYTTISALAFRNLEEDVGERGTDRSLTWSAVLLDEADAILLDQGTRPFWHARLTASSAKDWSHPLHIARTLEDRHFVRDRAAGPSVTLTPEGEAHVIASANGAALRPVDRLLLLHDVELAYAGTRIARPGHDYDIGTNRIVTMDPATGWHTPGIDHDWVAPLERELGFEPRPRSVARHAIDGITLLRRFEHIAGTSGTVIGEALDYTLLLGLPPAVVPPRKPRYDGLKKDRFAVSREAAQRWVAARVAEYGPERPILVATDSTHEAGELAELIRAEVPGDVDVRFVSDEKIAEQEIFETAGRPGVTIVSTRVSGRGVDIRLSPEALEHGGAVLFALGHSYERRLDRQLLGRVGRGGDRFDAWFVNHTQDPLMQQFANRALKWAAEQQADEPIESPMLDRFIGQAQKQNRRAALRSFAGQVQQGKADGVAYEMLAEWRQRLGIDLDGDVPEAFLAFAVDRYLTARFPGLAFEGGGDVDPEDAATEVARLAGLSDTEDDLVVTAVGKPEEARAVLANALTTALVAAAASNRRERERILEQAPEAEQAALDLRMLGVLRQLAQPDADVSSVEALRTALAPAATRLKVRRPSIARRADDIQRWTSEPAEESSAEAIGGLVAAVTELATGGNGHDGGEIAASVEQAAAAREAAAAGVAPDWSLHVERTAWKIASETIGEATQNLLASLDRLRFQLAQTTSAASYYRVYTDRVMDIRRAVEAGLAVEMCTNLLAGADPAAVDKVFIEREHAIAVRPQPDSARLKLPTVTPKEGRPAAATRRVLREPPQLIRHYVKGVRERLGKKAPPEKQLIRALAFVLESSPLTTLTDPDQVAKAYRTWRRSTTRDEISTTPWARRTIDRHVRAFLGMLHERGLSAPLPSGVRQRSRSLIRGARNALRGTNVGLGALGLVGGVLMAAVLVALPQSGDLDLSPQAEFLDRVLTAGTLSAGSLLGPALLALIGASWVRWVIGLPVTVDAGILNAERTGSLVLLFGGAVIVVAAGDTGGPIPLLGSVALWALVFGAGLVVRQACWLFEQMTHCHLTAGLAATAAGVGALPFLVELADSGRPLIIAGATAATLAITLPLRRARINAVALRIDPTAAERREAIDVPLTVRARLSVVPHAFALLSAWVLSCVVIDAGPLTRSLVAAVAYVAVLVAWALPLARSATRFDEWHGQMRRYNQAYHATERRPTLETALVWARRRVLLLELGTAVPLVALATVLARDMPAGALSELPVGVAAVFVAVAVLELGRACVRSVRSPLPAVIESTTDDVDSLGQYAQDAMRAVSKKLGVFVAVFLALSKAADLIGVWDLVSDLANFVKDLVT